jgi:translation elongation factor EF-Ts
MSKIEIIKRLRKSQLGGIPIKQLQKAIDATDQLDPNAPLQALIDAVLPSLRAQGALNTRNLEARESADGLVGVCRGTKGIGIVTVLCGTDFVALSDTMKKFTANIAHMIANNGTTDIQSLLESHYAPGSCSVSQHLDYMGLELGEKITISSTLYMPYTPGHSIGCYVHHPIHSDQENTTLGQSYSLVEIDKPDNGIAHNLAMHVFGNEITPIAATIDQIPTEVIEREKMAIEDLHDTNIPAAKAEMISKNRLQKRLGELALLTQRYIKAEQKETVADYIGPNINVLCIKHFRIRPIH